MLGLALAVVGIRLFDAAVAGRRQAGTGFSSRWTRGSSRYFALICLGTAVMFGLAPAMHIAKTDVNEILKEGGRSGSAGMRVRRWASALVVAELALTLVLLAGAGFMMRNFMTMYSLDIGVETSHLLTMSLALPEAKYPALEQRLAFYDQLQERLRDASSARSRSPANAPMQGGFPDGSRSSGARRSRGQEPPTVTMLAVDPRYFETLGRAARCAGEHSPTPTARPVRTTPSSTHASPRCTSPTRIRSAAKSS